MSVDEAIDDTSVLRDISQAVARHEQMQREAQRLLEERDASIVRALDRGVTSTLVAHAARLSQPRVVQIYNAARRAR